MQRFLEIYFSFLRLHDTANIQLLQQCNITLFDNNVERLYYYLSVTIKPDSDLPITDNDLPIKHRLQGGKC